MELTLERKNQTEGTGTFGNVAITPALNEDYWAYRVLLSPMQAVVGFPKFFTIGIGFAIEDADWNTNLPYTSAAEDIASHIAENKGDDSIADEDVVAAIKLIQEAVVADLAEVSK